MINLDCLPRLKHVTLSPISQSCFRSLTYPGYLDQARAYRDRAVFRARQQKHAHTLAMVLQISLEIDQSMKNDPAAQLRNAEEIFAHCTEHEDSPEPIGTDSPICKTLRISDRSTPDSYQLDFALARASDGALIICMDKSQWRHRHSGQFLMSDLTQVSG